MLEISIHAFGIYYDIIHSQKSLTINVVFIENVSCVMIY